MELTILLNQRQRKELERLLSNVLPSDDNREDWGQALRFEVGAWLEERSRG